MNLVELKNALDAAAAKLAESPDDAALKAAHDSAKTAYQTAKEADSSGKGGDDEDGDLDDSKLDERTKKYVEKLRRENAKHRTKASGNGTRLAKLEESLKKILGGEDDEPVEKKLESATAKTEALQFETAVLEAAIEHGVSKEDKKYFKFLVSERLSEMEEGAELPDEELADLAKAAKRANAGAGKSAGRSSVDDQKGGGKDPGRNRNVTVDQFVAMTVLEKSELYTSNKALYETLFAEAKAKRRI